MLIFAKVTHLRQLLELLKKHGHLVERRRVKRCIAQVDFGISSQFFRLVFCTLSVHVLKELSFLDQLAPLWDQLEALWRQSSGSNPALEDSQNQEDYRVTKSDATAEESGSDNQTEGEDDGANHQDGRDPIEELLVVEEDFKKGEEVEMRKSDDGRGVADYLKETTDTEERGKLKW